MQIRSDLVLEAREMIDERRTGEMESQNQLPDGVFVDSTDKESLLITRIRIESQAASEKLGKSQGTYVTIELKDRELNSLALQKEVSAAISEEIMHFIRKIPKPEPSVMIVGLGNRSITPDSLGPKVVDRMVVTRHLKQSDEIRNQLDERLGTVSAVAPGVMGITGIETGSILKGLIEVAQPDMVIAVDALASRKTSRVNTTIQISDAGIVPGSGVGNRRMELSEKTLGIPVIAIGVPTVVDALTLTRDLLEKAEGQEPEDEMLESLAETYGADMVVTPKNIDIAVERMSIALSNGLNMALHKGFDVSDISEYLM